MYICPKLSAKTTELSDQLLIQTEKTENFVYKDSTLFIFQCFHGNSIIRVHDAPHAHEPHATHAHVHEVPVLSRPEVHHPASVAGLLVHQPVSVHHVAGHAVGHAVTAQDVVTVVHQLVHLTTEVLPLVDPHPVVSTVLQHKEPVINDGILIMIIVCV